MQAADGGFGFSPTGTPAGGSSVTGKKRGMDWLIGHDLFLWSPKGFLTGTANTPGSILVGTHFERTNVSCEGRCNFAQMNGGQFHRDRILLREWDLWYFIAPRMSIGGSLLLYDASDLNTTGQRNLGVSHNRRSWGGGELVGGQFELEISILGSPAYSHVQRGVSNDSPFFWI